MDSVFGPGGHLRLSRIIPSSSANEEIPADEASAAVDANGPEGPHFVDEKMFGPGGLLRLSRSICMFLFIMHAWNCESGRGDWKETESGRRDGETTRQRCAVFITRNKMFGIVSFHQGHSQAQSWRRCPALC